MVEVHELTVYNPNELTSITGIVSTYAKIALGWCQIFATLEIRNQMENHVQCMRLGFSDDLSASDE
eukprot:CAMPEP_0170471826 /NCGR_PEP_ID=MMETSP0123-20130129/13983_1 /TAXON_ID=182087 /ORGANISM="Favella ehrenbergii, Strain Fehren 1" /LENGTH=65 /DNA_ID=CAMNT_0010739737 /DNA_START=181 /DNA_END=378 /DNA_ORIENTATION=-